MKNKKRPVTLLFLGLVVIVALNSCVKDNEVSSPDEGKVYMAQANIDRSKLKIYAIDSPQTVNFGASIAGFSGAPDNIDVQFEVDESLLTQLNNNYSYLNYHFVAPPEGSYTIETLNSRINKGRSDSDPLQMQIFANKLQNGLQNNIDYCIPIRIKTISAGSLDTTQSVSYFLIDSLYIRSRDITSHGTLTVSKENTSGINSANGSPKLTDGSLTSKFICPFSANIWMQLKMDSAQAINAYALTSGDDHPTRDPKSWNLQGSNDGSTWTTLDERTNMVFDAHPGTYKYDLNHADGKAYLYYRLVILSNYGDSNFQLIEWQLLQYY